VWRRQPSGCPNQPAGRAGQQPGNDIDSVVDNDQQRACGHDDVFDLDLDEFNDHNHDHDLHVCAKSYQRFSTDERRFGQRCGDGG
jgi:hypothetical protein